MPIARPLRERFEDHVSRVPGQGPNGDCHEWQGFKHGMGYGRIREAGGGSMKIGSHRVALMLEGIEIPDGMHVCHHCDNPPCCNPDHLFLGTSDDNGKDMVAKGRSKDCGIKGSKHHNSKLTEDMVKDIKYELRHGHRGIMKRLAEEYCVSKHTISDINTGRTWSHVK